MKTVKESALKWWSGLSYQEQEELLNKYGKQRSVEDIIYIFELLKF